jgi:hypothetical protein
MNLFLGSEHVQVEALPPILQDCKVHLSTLVTCQQLRLLQLLERILQHVLVLCKRVLSAVEVNYQ